MVIKQRTLSIIKPNIIIKNMIGDVIRRFETNNLYIVAIKMLWLTKKQASNFYYEHNNKLFFNNLINFMISGPIVVQVLEGENAIKRNREIMGSTDPAYALVGTIRADYADNITKNAIHGSDSEESAIREISYFFTKDEIYMRHDI